MLSFAMRGPKVALRWLAQPLLRLYRWIRCLPLGREPKWRKVSGGFSMLVDPSDWVDRLFYLGSYESSLVRLIAAVVKPGDVCIDVGAHKGYVTLHLSKAVGPAGRVISIEPDPRAMALLRGNCEGNRAENIALYSCLIGDVSETSSFVLSHKLGWSSRFPNELARSAISETIAAQTRPLDDLLTENTVPVTFIKIDVEGSEPLVLSGALETLRRFHPVVHVEINDGALQTGGKSAADIISPLTALGYELYSLMAERRPVRLVYDLNRVSHACADARACYDIVAIHPSSPAMSAISGLRFPSD
jgi:FkbM family methyltransferase